MPFDSVGEGELTNEGVHRVSRGAHDHANDDKHGSCHGHPTSTEEITEGADKGANSSECQQVSKDKPHPAVGASELPVNVRRNATCFRSATASLSNLADLPKR